MTGCPLGNRIPEWMVLTAQGLFLEAAAVSLSTSNMPEICSRVCPQEKLCEGACILNARTDPVAIGEIERFINDYTFHHSGVEAVQSPANGRKVAVIGSGPGGLACADELAKLGYGVTVFEAQLLPGGLLVNDIPAFKLEKHIVERRIDLLAPHGVEFRLGVRVGWDVSLAGLRDKFDAVFLGGGALANMPGSRKEYANALEESAQFQFLTNPTTLLGDAAGRGVAVRFVRRELGAPDASGRRSLRPVAGSEFEVPADLVLVAYGFDPVPFPAGSDLAQVATDKWGGFLIDWNQMTSLPGVFAGGDSVRGPSLIVVPSLIDLMMSMLPRFTKNTSLEYYPSRHRYSPWATFFSPQNPWKACRSALSVRKVKLVLSPGPGRAG